MKADSLAQRFSWLGGALCLDFVNSVEGRSTSVVHDRLDGPESLAAWCTQAGISKGRAQPWRSIDPPFLLEAVAFRDRLYPWLAALAVGGEVAGHMTRSAEEATFALVRRSSWRLGDGRAEIAWGGAPDDPRQVLWAIAWSAVDLVRGPELRRLRECANPDCHWLFVDRTRNGSRRWCDMTTCGNLIKARRFYQRSKQGHHR